MLVSHRKKFIYTKTAKTAGTSIESYFEKYCMPDNLWTFKHARNEYISSDGIIGFRGSKDQLKKQIYYNHMHAIEIQRNIGKQLWDDYYKFSVIRDPFDKLVSAFYFSARDSDGSIESFRKWLINGGIVKDQNTYLIDGKVCMDYFIRYENLHDGVKHVCNTLKLPYSSTEIPKLKTKFRNRGIPLHEFYDAKSIGIVQEAYGFELDYFGYTPPTNKLRTPKI